MGNKIPNPPRPEGYPGRKPPVERGSYCQGFWTIEIHHGDITQADTDVIVNAANARLSHGAGVAGAISSKGGPYIQDASDVLMKRPLSSLPLEKRPSYDPKKKTKVLSEGDAILTGAGWLFCKAVVHAVGPVWAGGDKGEPEQLKLAVWNSLELANKKKMASISLPAISSGIFGFPKDLCAEIMFDAVLEYFDSVPKKSTLKQVCFTNLDAHTVGIFQNEFNKRFPEHSIPTDELVGSHPHGGADSEEEKTIGRVADGASTDNKGQKKKEAISEDEKDSFAMEGTSRKDDADDERQTKGAGRDSGGEGTSDDPDEGSVGRASDDESSAD